LNELSIDASLSRAAGQALEGYHARQSDGAVAVCCTGKEYGDYSIAGFSDKFAHAGG
jgi:hypothetical protein